MIGVRTLCVTVLGVGFSSPRQLHCIFLQP